MVAVSPSAATVHATEFTLVGIAALMVGARIHLRLGIQRLPINASDILMCVTWLSSAVTCCFDIVYDKKGALRPDVSATLDGFEATPEEIEFLWKLQFAYQFVFISSFYLCKAMLLTLYVNFFPIFMKIRRGILWATIIYCSCAYITTILTTIAICRPIEGNWSQDLEVQCPDIVFAQLFYITWSLNFSADVMIFCLPFLVLHQLKLQPKVKASVYFTFILGIINLAITLTRLVEIHTSAMSFLSFSIIQLWNVLDVNIGLIIACMPTLRPYLSHAGKMYATRLTNQTCSQMSTRNRPGFSESSRHQILSKSNSRTRDSADDVDDIEPRSINRIEHSIKLSSRTGQNTEELGHSMYGQINQ